MDYRIVEVRARKFEWDVVHYQVEQFEVWVSDEWEICADSDGDDSCHELLGDAKVELECLRSKPIYTVIPEEERQPKREKYPKDTTEIGDY